MADFAKAKIEYEGNRMYLIIEMEKELKKKIDMFDLFGIDVPEQEDEDIIIAGKKKNQ